MAKVPFQTLTNGEKYKSYKKRQHACTAGKWTCVIAPFATVFGLKFNEYIKVLDQGETIKLTIGCVLAIVVAAVAIILEIKKSDETKHLAPVVGWGIALLFIWLLECMLKDLMLIVGAEFAGQCAATGINAYGKHAREEAAEYKKLARADNTLGVKVKRKNTVRVKVKM